MTKWKRDFAAIWILIVLLIFVSQSEVTPSSAVASDQKQSSGRWAKLAEEHVYISRIENGHLNCGAASEEEIHLIAQSSVGLQTHASPHRMLLTHDTGNITFAVRVGAGLSTNPQAERGYLKALQIWSSRLGTPAPVTIAMDVDYAPVPVGIAHAKPQPLIGIGEYSDWRNALIANANSGKEMALFDLLPDTAVPTDLGDTDTFVIPSASLRAAGLIPAVANTEAELAQFGPPPLIVFSDTVRWDFNPDDGIDAGRVDFVGTALHEIGHMLGFFTRVGTTEINPNLLLTVSAFDIYRFRSGTTMETFKSAKRILSAGGEHFFYAGEQQLPLSTARLDLAGGDGFSADHWKDDIFTGTRLGIMDPQQMLVEKINVTKNDLAALKVMGYRIKGEDADHSPYIGFLKGDLQGDSLTLTGTVYDIDADVSTAQISLLDRSGNVLLENGPVAFGLGERINDFVFNLSGLNSLPAAMQARILFSDGQSNSDRQVLTMLDQADAGAPAINKATFKGSKLTVKGKGLLGQIQIEINGVIVATVESSSNKNVKIKANRNDLNIANGANRLRIIKDSLRSNIAALIF